MPGPFQKRQNTIKNEDPLFSIENNAVLSARMAENVNHMDSFTRYIFPIFLFTYRTAAVRQNFK